MTTRTLMVLCGGLAAAPAVGQSVNIDFGDLTGTPVASYGAAGLAGTWNALTADPGEPQALMGLAGQPLGVTVSYNWGTLFAFDDPGPGGDDARLLEDGLGGFGDVMTSVLFNGLANGTYQVIAYAWTPGQPGDRTLVVIDDDVTAGEIAGGAWPGTLDEGVTHVVFETVEVSDGTLTVGAVGGYWGASGFLGGLQLRRESPADLNGDGMVNTTDLLELLGDWGACKGCAGDLNGDGDVGTADLLILLGAWG